MTEIENITANFDCTKLYNFNYYMLNKDKIAERKNTLSNQQT